MTINDNKNSHNDDDNNNDSNNSNYGLKPSSWD